MGCGLFWREACAEADRLGHAVVEVGDDEIEVHLLRDVAARPARRAVVGDAHGGDDHRPGTHADVCRRRVGDDAVEHRRPELGERNGIVAVEVTEPIRAMAMTAG